MLFLSFLFGYGLNSKAGFVVFIMHYILITYVICRMHITLFPCACLTSILHSTSELGKDS